MKKLSKRITLLVLAFCMLFVFAACSSKEDGGAPEAAMNGAADGNAEGQQPPAGLLTAGAWNDNENYADWNALFAQNGDQTGKFFSYYGAASWGFATQNRVKVTVTNGQAPIAGASVVCKNASGDAVFGAVTDALGVAYLFPTEQSGTVTAVLGTASSEASFTADARDVTLTLDTQSAKQNVIELMFVVDVTGSMGDELTFLKNEISDVVRRVASDNSGVQIDLALLFYRDQTDKEPFCYYDFQNVTDPQGLSAQQDAINSQKASGGGDFPEAVDEALERAVNAQWSSGATTKIIFQILDAPPHETQENQTRLHTAALRAAEKGIRFCPVLCSGADTLTEYLMRQIAICTGGTFVFITDDSGIGNAHHDPQLPNATVEALNELMIRLINGYHSGRFAPPVSWRENLQ